MRLLCSISILFFAFACLTKAQSDTLVIKLKNGTSEKIAIANIGKVSFERVTNAEDQGSTSKGLTVRGNFPNPFTTETEIEFTIPNGGSVEVRIFNTSGKQIQTLNCDNCTAGRNVLVWNCLDKDGNNVPSGAYIYEVRFGNEVQTKKMVLVK